MHRIEELHQGRGREKRAHDNHGIEEHQILVNPEIPTFVTKM